MTTPKSIAQTPIKNLSGSPYRILTDFFERNGVKKQQFTIDPVRRTTLVGEKGTRLTIFPNAIVNQQGVPVQQPVDVFLKEIFSKPEMVLSNKGTTSQDRLLESGGQLGLFASLNGEPLLLKTPIRVEMPVQPTLCNPLAMRLSQGSYSGTRAFGAKNAFDWKPVSPKPLKVCKIRGQKYFKFDLRAFSWINCNYHYARKAPRTMVSAKIIAPVERLEDQMAFLVFRDCNAVASMHSSGRNRLVSFNIPTKRAAKVIALGLNGGRLYYGFSTIERTSNLMTPVKLNPYSEAELLEVIRGND